MKTKLMVLMLMAGGAMFAETHVGIGVQIGGPAPVYVPAPAPPPPPPVMASEYRSPCPGPGYVWVDGYYDEYGNWFDGYWTLPPYTGAYWTAPRWNAGRYYFGYWNGPRGYYRAEPPRPAYRDYDRGYRAYDRGGYRDHDYDRRPPERFDHDRGRDRDDHFRGNGYGPGRGGEFRNGYHR